MNYPEIQQLKTTILYFLEKQLCCGSTDPGWDQQKWFRLLHMSVFFLLGPAGYPRHAILMEISEAQEGKPNHTEIFKDFLPPHTS